MSVIYKTGIIMGSGGGGGGTSNYNDLSHKPAIDGVTLTENTTKAALGLAKVLVYKGQVATYNDLPSSGNTDGDVWNVAATDKNYVWNGTGWDDLGGAIFYNAGTGINITNDVIDNTGVIDTKINNVSIKDANGNANIPNASASAAGVIMLSNNSEMVLGSNGTTASWDYSVVFRDWAN